MNIFTFIRIVKFHRWFVMSLFDMIDMSACNFIRLVARLCMILVLSFVLFPHISTVTITASPSINVRPFACESW